MSQFTTRAMRLIEAVESYKNNFKRWDTLHLVPKINITSAGNGHMEGTFEVTEDMCNCGTTLHGGFTSSVIDYFTVYSAMQHPKGCLAWTTDMSVSFLGITAIGEKVRVISKPVKITKSRIVMECLLQKEKDSSPIARAIIGFMVTSPPPIFLDVLPFDPRIKDE